MLPFTCCQISFEIFFPLVYPTFKDTFSPSALDIFSKISVGNVAISNIVTKRLTFATIFLLFL